MNCYFVIYLKDCAPEASTYQTLYKLYPFELMLGHEEKMAAMHALQVLIISYYMNAFDKVNIRYFYFAKSIFNVRVWLIIDVWCGG